MRKIVFLLLIPSIFIFGVSLRILSFPAGKVFVDGKFVGQAPVIVDLEKGKHEIVVRREGFLEERSIIEVSIPETVIFKLKASLFLFKEVIPVAVAQYEVTETPPKENVEERKIEEKLVEILKNLNVKVEKIDLDEEEIKSLVEDFNFSILEKIAEEFPGSRYSIVGQFIHISSENIIKGRLEIWVYDLKKKEILTSMSVEEGGRDLGMLISRAVEELSPKIVELLVEEELKQKEILKKKEGTIAIKGIDYSEYPNIKIRFFVTNPEGEVETDLKKENIMLFEGGEKIKELALSKEYDKNTYVILVIDASGSMKRSMEVLKSSAIEFLESMPDGLNYSLVVFGRKKEPVVDVYPSIRMF